MTLLQTAFDAVLGIALLWLAWRALASPNLFRAIVLFIAFGLLMALAWVRLEAPDVALAEAAIGAGLTGALLLAAWARLESATETSRVGDPGEKPNPVPDKAQTGKMACLMLVLLLSGIAAWLGYAVFGLHLLPGGLAEQVATNLDASGVSNPVTAVLLNFRGHDTLLEIAVLLLALLGVWSLSIVRQSPDSAPGLVLDTLSRVLVPILILVAGYLLWAGTHAPGGAFQAGSVLGAAGVLLLLSGWYLDERLSGLPLRAVLVLGLGVFITVAAGLLFIGGEFLEYPPSLAGALILLIEVAATLSIGITLAALFLGGQPDTGTRR